MLLVLPGRPADPLIAASQRAARLAEQHTAQPAPVPVEQEVAQVRAQRLAVAEIVVPLDAFVPELGVLLLLDPLQAQRLQVSQAGRDQRLGSAARGRGQRLPRSPGACSRCAWAAASECRLLELFQQAQGGRDAVAASGRAPVELLADRLRQFLAAQGREPGHRLLDSGDLPAREAPAEEGGGLEILDAGIHGSSQEACS